MDDKLFCGQFKISFFANEMLNGGHTLIAGATGSGKSTALENFLYSLCLAGPNVRSFAVIDLKRVSLRRWTDVPHCLAYATEPSDARIVIKIFINNLKARFEEMEQKRLQKFTGTKLFLVIDEAADLIATCPDVMPDLIKLMRLGRAANISVVYATQDPSKKTISAQIQQNCENLIALRCRDSIASRQVIGVGGAELLPRYGQALFYNPNTMNVVKIDIKLIPDEQLNEYIGRVAEAMPNTHNPTDLQSKVIYFVPQKRKSMFREFIDAFVRMFW